ncbi:hypothetical protein NQ315_005752 [Exocentrus adspersus]|uniref:Integrase catalytic domain-containing protein n=1 Tax=Exocentrus adspersus TaxID=1586481 RepID=A0AAV8VB80_9CUCU|nr:hypothetical protein NQ315_005752 [Exocentrus adspersus]
MSTIAATHLRTSPYHPQANGMVERLHRQLKAAIKCHKDNNWVEKLPLILLGVRTAIKEDLESTAAEMVFGSTIRLPGEFFSNCKQKDGTSEYVNKLREHIRNVKPTPGTRHRTNKVFISKDLYSSPYVFLRNDAGKKGLELPYDGPYKVLDRDAKTFDIQIGNKNVKVSIDRLKPAFILLKDDGTNTASKEGRIKQPSVDSNIENKLTETGNNRY